MPVDVTIKLTGLALCFRRRPRGGTQKVWNIAFICDQQHRLDLFVNGNATPKPNWRPNADIMLDVRNALGSGESQPGEVDKLLNISNDRYGHGELNVDESNLKVNRISTPHNKLVWMQVPRSTITVHEPHNTKIMRTLPDYGVPVRVPARGKEVRIHFSVDREVELVPLDFDTRLEVPGFPAFSIPAVSNKIDLVLANRCDDSQDPRCKRNDFVDLYDFVYHLDERKEYKYITWAEDSETVVFNRKELESQAERIRKLKDEGWVVIDEGEYGIELGREGFKQLMQERKHSTYGNCDPVVSEPPPGGGD